MGWIDLILKGLDYKSLDEAGLSVRDRQDILDFQLFLGAGAVPHRPRRHFANFSPRRDSSTRISRRVPRRCLRRSPGTSATSRRRRLRDLGRQPKRCAAQTAARPAPQVAQADSILRLRARLHRASPPCCRLCPGPPQDGIQGAVTGEALTEDALHDEGLVRAHPVGVEEQSEVRMRSRSPASQAPVQAAAGIGKGKGHARLPGDLAHDAAGFDDFTLRIRLRRSCSRRWLQLCAPIVKPSACNWRSCALVRYGLTLLKVTGSVDAQARQQQPRPAVPRPRAVATASAAAATSLGSRCGSRSASPKGACRSAAPARRPASGRNREPSPSSVTIASTWAKGMRMIAPMHSDAALSRNSTRLSIRSVTTKNTQRRPRRRSNGATTVAHSAKPSSKVRMTALPRAAAGAARRRASFA